MCGFGTARVLDGCGSGGSGVGAEGPVGGCYCCDARLINLPENHLASAADRTPSLECLTQQAPGFVAVRLEGILRKCPGVSQSVALRLSVVC